VLWATLPVLGILMLAAVFTVHSTRESVACDRYATTDGSDKAAGTSSDPFRTAQRLVDSLEPGETACLRSGTYTETDGTLTISSGGAAGKRVILRSAPGERATFKGRLYVTEEADHVTVRDMVLNGSTSPQGSSEGVLPSPTVDGDHATFVGNEVTNRHKGICFSIGGSFALVEDVLIRDNRIHNCGVLPRTNLHHGIYVSSARNSRIVGNWIYDNADRGIQLYPNAQGTLIENNVIDGNGQGLVFSGRENRASSDNTVRNNVISGSQEGWNVYSNWSQTSKVGRSNVVRDNCLWASSQEPYYNQNGGSGPEEVGFDAYDNLVADPKYVNREAGDFEVPDKSPCRAVLDERDSSPPEN
jgi:parallel beta-helix repeat protein